MAGRQTPPAVVETHLAEGHREGSRWINRRPEGEEVASWFTDNVKIHEGLDPAHYVGGVTLIGGQEKLKEARQAAGGSIQFVDVLRYAWTPYAKIETRIAYFWDLMALKADEWVGAIEPAEQARIEAAGVYNLNMPAGMFRLPIATGPSTFVHYVGAVMQVKIYQAGTLEWAQRVRKIYDREVVDGTPRSIQVDEVIEEYLRGIPVAIYPPATKQIATVGRNEEEDPFSLMKAETGAIGRALGMAGMLVLPGSGVATAEDMQEAQAGAGGAALTGASEPPPVQPAEAPDAAEVEQATDERIQEKLAQLQSTSAEGYERLAAWSAERKIDLEKPKGTQLRGLELQLDRELKRLAPE